MKTVLGLVLLASLGGQAAENVVCSLIKRSDKSSISVAIDLTKPFEEYYHPEGGITVGKNSYSFILEPSFEKDVLSLLVTFQDSNDEVGQEAWDIDLAESRKRNAKDRKKPVIFETISDIRGRNSMQFVCYHNQNRRSSINN